MLSRIALFGVLALALGLALFPSAQAHPVPGPGSVLAVHHRLLAALDRGDAGGLRACFSTSRGVELLLVDEELGAPLSIDSVDALNRAFPTGENLGWKSAITSSTTECPSGRLASGTLEFERRREVGDTSCVRRYRSTALLRHEDGELRIFYWHVSPAQVFELTDAQEVAR